MHLKIKLQGLGFEQRGRHSVNREPTKREVFEKIAELLSLALEGCIFARTGHVLLCQEVDHIHYRDNETLQYLGNVDHKNLDKAIEVLRNQA